jgi:hypothetical protein
MSVPTPYDPESIRLASAAFADRRGEINERSRAQHTIIQIAVTAVGTVLGFVLGTKADQRVLLVLPLISTPLGMLYLDHGLNIANIGEFIRTRIVPVLEVVPGASHVLGYEAFMRDFERRRALRVLLFGAPLLLLFAGFPAGALVYLCGAGLVNTWTVKALWAVGALLVLWYLVFWWTFMFPGFWQKDPGGTARRR